jgi:hypothetical protein
MEPFKNEVIFGADNFQQPKILSSKESIAQVLLNLFFMRPGNLPSLPHIGINIREYLYRMEDDLDAEELKAKLYDQASVLIPYISLGDVRIFVTSYNGQSLLIVSIPVFDDSQNNSIVYGFSKDQSGNTIFNYQFQNDLLQNV